MDDWNRTVEDKIQEAIRAGKFDDLPGKGQPLDLDENPFAPPDTWAAHRLLRNNGFTLPWIEERREILAALEAARTKLARAWQWHQDTLAGGDLAWAESGWKRALHVFQEQAGQLNRRIRHYNLTAPSVELHLLLIDAEVEIKRAVQEQP